jgi:hypothetical protein
LALVFLALPLHAQPTTQPVAQKATTNWLGLPAGPLDEPLQTDRPDFTETPSTVPYGRMQLEGGYTFAYDDEDGHRVSEQTVPEFLLRVGLVEGFELRVGWEGASLTEDLFQEENDAGRMINREVHDDGASDMSVGFKVRLIEQRGLVPDLSVIPELGLPTGKQTKTAGDVEPAVKWLWSYELTERLSLSGNVNLAVLNSEQGQFFQTSASLSLGFQIADWLGSYIEYFGFYPAFKDTESANYIDGGFTFPITNNLQFDVRAGFGLNKEADDLFAGAGFAIRW